MASVLSHDEAQKVLSSITSVEKYTENLPILPKNMVDSALKTLLEILQPQLEVLKGGEK